MSGTCSHGNRAPSFCKRKSSMVSLKDNSQNDLARDSILLSKESPRYRRSSATLAGVAPQSICCCAQLSWENGRKSGGGGAGVDLMTRARWRLFRYSSPLLWRRCSYDCTCPSRSLRICNLLAADDVRPSCSPEGLPACFTMRAVSRRVSVAS